MFDHVTIRVWNDVGALLRHRAAGPRQTRAPGERIRYYAGYHGAFVLDPDGHNVEAVNHNR